MNAASDRGDVQIVPDLAELTWNAARRFVSIAQAAIAARGVFRVALSGGGTPLPLYALLALPEWASTVAWAQTHVYWCDERCVPPADPQSNYGAAFGTLLERVPIPTAHIHRIEGEIDPADAADRYAQVITGINLDLALLGMGDDGHTASLFPGTSAVHEHERLAVAVYVEKHGSWRVTLTPPVLNSAENVIFLVGGASKAATLHDVLRGPYQPDLLPAQVIRPASGRLVWLVDQSAAAHPGDIQVSR